MEPTLTLKAWFCGPGRDGVPSLPADEKAEKSEKAVNGEDKGDSGVETQNSEGNADEECDPLGPNCYYDKSKSFFDNISCDDTRSLFKKKPLSPLPRASAVSSKITCTSWFPPLQESKRQVWWIGFPTVSLILACDHIM